MASILNNILESYMNLMQLLDSYTFIEMIVAFYCVLFVTSAIHESLHYLTAKSLGFDAKKIKIGTLTIFENETLSIGLIPIKNVVEWYPNQEVLTKKNFNYKVVLVFLAGPVGNLITLIAGLMTNSFFSPMLIVVSLLLFITNILPLAKGNDGYYITKALYYELFTDKLLVE